MSKKKKNQKAILQKLGIDELNAMQQAAHQAIYTGDEVILLSPTGTGKTLAFLLPILSELDRELEQMQALILVPSRELAIQIEQVARDMGSGFKVNAVYGGRAVYKDKLDLQHPPAILIGTPGRVADHMRRGTLSVDHVKTLVLDEFDKSLETGFEKEMTEIVEAIPSVKKKILTSATEKVAIPDFVGLQAPKRLDFLEEGLQRLTVKAVVSPAKDKLDTLANLLGHLGKSRGILFCNFKDTISFVSDFLQKKKIDHVCFYGGLEQQDRERALIQFRNGTHRLLVATDLAARGIDVPELDFIIHYQLPIKEEEFIHRNGRTARMQADGVAYVLKYQKEPLPDFIQAEEIMEIAPSEPPPIPKWTTLFLSGGRKDKISKGDIAGWFLKQGNLKPNELGLIELKQDCAFVAVPRKKAQELVKVLDNGRVKKRKVRVTRI
jgi:superfamily II DNA/RNA helicase